MIILDEMLQMGQQKCNINLNYALQMVFNILRKYRSV